MDCQITIQVHDWPFCLPLSRFSLAFSFVMDYVARMAFKLPKKKDWVDINPKLFETQPELLNMLISAYSNKLDNMDVYIGGMLESYGNPGTEAKARCTTCCERKYRQRMHGAICRNSISRPRVINQRNETFSYLFHRFRRII